MCENDMIVFENEYGEPVSGEIVPLDEPVVNMESVPESIVAMLREAKEKHLPVMITNNDETRALLIKDANDLKCKITVNGIPFEEI